jgi:hypothetical protein
MLRRESCSFPGGENPAGTSAEAPESRVQSWGEILWPSGPPKAVNSGTSDQRSRGICDGRAESSLGKEEAAIALKPFAVTLRVANRVRQTCQGTGNESCMATGDCSREAQTVIAEPRISAPKGYASERLGGSGTGHAELHVDGMGRCVTAEAIQPNTRMHFVQRGRASPKAMKRGHRPNARDHQGAASTRKGYAGVYRDAKPSIATTGQQLSHGQSGPGVQQPG